MWIETWTWSFVDAGKLVPASFSIVSIEKKKKRSGIRTCWGVKWMERLLMMETSSSTRSEPAVLFAWQTYLPASSTRADCSTSTPARACILSELKTIVVPDTDSRNQRYVGGGIPCEIHDSTIVSPVRIAAGFTRSLKRGGDGLRCSETEKKLEYRKI